MGLAGCLCQEGRKANPGNRDTMNKIPAWERQYTLCVRKLGSEEVFEQKAPFRTGEEGFSELSLGVRKTEFRKDAKRGPAPRSRHFSLNAPFARDSGSNWRSLSDTYRFVFKCKRAARMRVPRIGNIEDSTGNGVGGRGTVTCISLTDVCSQDSTT